jgi:hypothetical protein
MEPRRRADATQFEAMAASPNEQAFGSQISIPSFLTKLAQVRIAKLF